MKTAIILVGNHEATEDRYRPIVNEFKSNGWQNVVLYEPDWSTKRVVSLVEDVVARLPHNSESLTLLGFSLGAMIALIVGSRIPVENLILCSPSGFFAEYDPLLSKDDQDWAIRNLKDFRDFSATDTLSNVQANRGFILAGQAELEQWPDFRKWIDDLRAQTAWQYDEIPEIGHEIETPAYQNEIKKVIHAIA